MVNRKRLSNHDFLASVRAYLPMEAAIWETEAEGRPRSKALMGMLNENTFYLFDGEAVAAVAAAIEDLAFEEAAGNLLAALQNFQEFEPHRERYSLLGATIDKVQVLAAGSVPKRPRSVRFLTDQRGLTREFRAVLYEGPRQQAMVVSRQTGQGGSIEDRQFHGFYTFNQRVIAAARQDLLALAAGDAGDFREFTRLQAIDDAAKQMKSEFARQRQFLEEALRKLQLEPGRYRARQFSMDLEKGWARLEEWKTQLPAMLARVQGD